MAINDIKISAIVPVYNGAEFLAQALQSLVAQSEPFTEIIVIDDASTDDTLAIIQHFQQRCPYIRLLRHEKNQGVCATLNHGIEQAIGDYILLGAADDWYGSSIVALAKQIVQQFPAVGLICGAAMVQRYAEPAPFHRMLPYPKNTLLTGKEFQSIAKQHYVMFNGAGGTMLNRQAVLQAGMLHPELRWDADWLLCFVTAFQYGIYYTDTIFVHINMRKQSYSEGRRVWPIQKHIMRDMINILDQRYPKLWHAFKDAALLPHYTLRYLPLFLTCSCMRRFLTIKLIWKFCINNRLIAIIGRLFPYRIILAMKKLLQA